MTVCAARVTEIETMGAEIVRVRLEPLDAAFRFTAGQWIDLGVALDGEEVVAGFSPASAPSEKGWFDLGIRISGKNRVTQWFHNEAKPGDEVRISGGHGQCVYEPQADDRLTLIAGGIGITPLLSMLYAFAECPDAKAATLFLSVSEREAPPFTAQLDALAQDPRITVHRHTTSPGDREQRLSADDIVARGAGSGGLFYLCGPAHMIDDLAASLVAKGIAQDRVRYEKWW